MMHLVVYWQKTEERLNQSINIKLKKRLRTELKTVSNIIKLNSNGPFESDDYMKKFELEKIKRHPLNSSDLFALLELRHQ